MSDEEDTLSWDLDSAISLLKNLSLKSRDPSVAPQLLHPSSDGDKSHENNNVSLGDFTSLWNFLGRPYTADEEQVSGLVKYEVNNEPVAELDLNQLNKGVRWRDEVDGADLEDNVEPVKVTAAYIRNKKTGREKSKSKRKS